MKNAKIQISSIFRIKPRGIVQIPHWWQQRNQKLIPQKSFRPPRVCSAGFRTDGKKTVDQTMPRGSGAMPRPQSPQGAVHWHHRQWMRRIHWVGLLRWAHKLSFGTHSAGTPSSHSTAGDRTGWWQPPPRSPERDPRGGPVDEFSGDPKDLLLCNGKDKWD